MRRGAWERRERFFPALSPSEGARRATCPRRSRRKRRGFLCRWPRSRSASGSRAERVPGPPGGTWGLAKAACPAPGMQRGRGPVWGVGGSSVPCGDPSLDPVWRSSLLEMGALPQGTAFGKGAAGKGLRGCVCVCVSQGKTFLCAACELTVQRKQGHSNGMSLLLSPWTHHTL